jgi:hypothetical protein
MLSCDDGYPVVILVMMIVCDDGLTCGLCWFMMVCEDGWPVGDVGCDDGWVVKRPVGMNHNASIADSMSDRTAQTAVNGAR